MPLYVFQSLILLIISSFASAETLERTFVVHPGKMLVHDNGVVSTVYEAGDEVTIRLEASIITINGNVAPGNLQKTFTVEELSATYGTIPRVLELVSMPRDTLLSDEEVWNLATAEYHAEVGAVSGLAIRTYRENVNVSKMPVEQAVAFACKSLESSPLISAADVVYIGGSDAMVRVDRIGFPSDTFVELTLHSHEPPPVVDEQVRQRRRFDTYSSVLEGLSSSTGYPAYVELRMGSVRGISGDGALEEMKHRREQ